MISYFKSFSSFPCVLLCFRLLCLSKKDKLPCLFYSVVEGSPLTPLSLVSYFICSFANTRRKQRREEGMHQNNFSHYVWQIATNSGAVGPFEKTFVNIDAPNRSEEQTPQSDLKKTHNRGSACSKQRVFGKKGTHHNSGHYWPQKPEARKSGFRYQSSCPATRSQTRESLRASNFQHVVCVLKETSLRIKSLKHSAVPQDTFFLTMIENPHFQRWLQNRTNKITKS